MDLNSNNVSNLNLNYQFEDGFISDKVLMVKPTLFATNYQTLLDNKFMVEVKESVQEKALNESNQFVSNLVTLGVKVQVEQQCHDSAVDSVFPNNWFSTHKNVYFPEGLLIIYPLKSENRRLERDENLIAKLKSNYKYFIDLSYLEQEGEFLESTGCLIFDNINRNIYCSISERASERALNIFIEIFNKYSLQPFKLVTFHAEDLNSNAIYHTNVLMSVLEKHIVICLETIKDEKERENVIKEIKDSSKELVDVSFKELKNFGCNIISVKNKENKTVLIMSKAALDGFSEKTKSALKNDYIFAVNDISTIELVGGGSTRCMVAEIYEAY